MGAVAMAIGGAAACSQASSPSHPPGDDYTQDVEGSTQGEQAYDGNYDDGFFLGTDGPYGTGYGMTDVYAVLTVCLPPDGGDASARVDAAAKDGGSYAVTDAAAASPGAGAYGAGTSSCEPIPAACTSSPNCPCLIEALAPSLPCDYPHCDLGDVFSLYCP